LAFSSLDIKNFKEGDEISIEFNLEDEHQTEIKKKAVVRSVRQRVIGCEFEKTEEAIGSPLWQYINMK